MAVALLAAATTVGGSTWGATAPETVLVGYSPAHAEAARLAIEAAGGTVLRASPELGVSVVLAASAAAFQAAASSSSLITYVETNDAVGGAGAQWNGAQWNGAQWNGAQWNGAQWNGAQWNGAQWNGAQWNGAHGNGDESGVSLAQQRAIRWAASAFRDNADPSWTYDTATTDPGLMWQWGAWRIDAPDASASWSGSRTAKLCVLDSGVAWNHPDIAPNMWTGPLGEHGWNAIDPGASAYDDAGHGTHVAGVAAAAIGNAFGVAGVANVQIMSVKVLDANGQGEEDDLAFGLTWCATNGADVALMALSATEPGPTLDRAIQYAADHDVLMIASAGNDGPCVGCVAFPANDPRVLAVSAIDGRGKLADFSSTGPEVALAAPGMHIIGPFLDAPFAFGSGTSQAAALAAGAAALVRDAYPDLTATQTANILTASADGGAGGVLDVAAALALADAS